MDPDNQDAPEVLETPEAAAAKAAEEAEAAAKAAEEAAGGETADEKIARLEKEKAELESKNNQLFERTKKAEQNKDLSADDIIALTGVAAEDRDRVRKWATTNGTSIADALADPDLKIILDTHAEERRTANATINGSGRGSSKVTGEQLLEKAQRTNEVPESDEDMAKLAAAREARLSQKKQHRT